jgi:hypothetical protein
MRCILGPFASHPTATASRRKNLVDIAMRLRGGSLEQSLSVATGATLTREVYADGRHSYRDQM